jgi:hypothetical protein
MPANGSGLFSKMSYAFAHLVKPGPGVSGALHDLRSDVSKALKPLAALTVDEFTDAPVADTDAFRTAGATSTTAQNWTGSALNGVVGQAALAYARPVTVTTTDSAGSYAGAVTVTGTDVTGKSQTDTITITNNTTTSSTKLFKTVTKLAVPAQLNTSGNLQVGFGAALGLSKPIVARAGRQAVVQEVSVGAVVTTGTFASAASAGPCGSYTPAAAPDGTRDYAVYYEYDGTVDNDSSRLTLTHFA